MKLPRFIAALSHRSVAPLASLFRSRIAALLALTLLAAIPYHSPRQPNHPPVVRIIAPDSNATCSASDPLSYEIRVSDPEDGDSRYDEINTKEVLLSVMPLKPGPAMTIRTPGDPGPLAIMAADNCYNCHQFKGHLLGPSFFDIARRYPATNANIDTLARRIRDGSSGIWAGSEKMPSHPELTAAQIRSTVRWILAYAGGPGINFYNGTTGLLRFPTGKPGIYVLTASYTDHGPKDQPGRRLTGSHSITVHVK